VLDADGPHKDVELDLVIIHAFLLFRRGGVGFDLAVAVGSLHIEPVEFVVLLVVVILGIVGGSLETLGLQILIETDVLLWECGDAGGA